MHKSLNLSRGVIYMHLSTELKIMKEKWKEVKGEVSL